MTVRTMIVLTTTTILTFTYDDDGIDGIIITMLIYIREDICWHECSLQAL